jgi:hypothetical protein
MEPYQHAFDDGERGWGRTTVVWVDHEDHVAKEMLQAVLGKRFEGRHHTTSEGRKNRTVVYLSL